MQYAGIGRNATAIGEAMDSSSRLQQLAALYAELVAKVDETIEELRKLRDEHDEIVKQFVEGVTNDHL